MKRVYGFLVNVILMLCVIAIAAYMVNASTTEMDTPLGHVKVDYSYTITHSDEDASTPDIIEVTPGNEITETATASISYIGPITVSGLSVHTEITLEGGGRVIASKSEDRAIRDIPNGSSFTDSGSLSILVPADTEPGQYYLTASAYTQLPMIGKKGDTQRYLVKVLSKNPTPGPAGLNEVPAPDVPTPTPTPVPKAEEKVVANTSIDTKQIQNSSDYVRQASENSSGSGTVNNTISGNGLNVTVTGDVVSSGGGHTVMNNTTVTVDSGNRSVVTQGNFVIDDTNHTTVIDNMTMRIETRNESGAQAVVTIQGNATQDANGTTLIDKPVIVIASNNSTSVTLRGDSATVTDDGKTSIKNATLETGVLQGSTPELKDAAVAIALNINTLNGTPELKMTITPEATSDAQTSFSLAALDNGTGIVNTAYVLTVEKSGLTNGNQSGNGITNAVLTMKVSREWVEANGGKDNIKVFRYDAPSHTTEALETHYVGSEFRFNDGAIVPIGLIPESSPLRSYGHTLSTALFRFNDVASVPLDLVPEGSPLRKYGTVNTTYTDFLFFNGTMLPDNEPLTAIFSPAQGEHKIRLRYDSGTRYKMEWVPDGLRDHFTEYCTDQGSGYFTFKVNNFVPGDLIPEGTELRNASMAQVRVFELKNGTKLPIDRVPEGSEWRRYGMAIGQTSFQFRNNTDVPLDLVPEGSPLRSYGTVRSNLETVFRFNDGVTVPISMVPEGSPLRSYGTEIMTFQAISPHGLSVFALTAIASLSQPMASTGSSDSGIMGMLPMAGSIIMANPAYLGALLIVLALVIAGIAIVVRSRRMRRKSKGNK